jgi:hypothetical protein
MILNTLTAYEKRSDLVGGQTEKKDLLGKMTLEIARWAQNFEGCMM